MKKAKKSGKAQKAANKRRVGRGKSKGKPPAALRKKKRAPRAVAPPPRQVGLLDAIGEVMSECEQLGSEMRQWADNLEDKFSGTQKYEAVNQAADTLEEAVGADPVDEKTMSFLNEVKITIQDLTPRRRGYSRSAQLGQSINILGDVIVALEEYTNQDEPKQAIANDLHTELDEIEGNLQGVDFPGMYG